MADKPKPKPKPAAKKPPQKPKPTVAIRFDAKSVRAGKIAKIASSKLVTSITNETREAIRVVVSRAIREGIPPYDAARLIVGVVSEPGATTNEVPGLIGLNTPQVHAALNYRVGLIDAGLTQVTVDKLMSKYVARKQRERAELIAKSELMWALNTGAEAGYKQAVEQGYLPNETRVEWITTPDERACVRPNGGCVAMNGKTKPIGGTFPDGSIGPPKHPACRCSIGVWAGHAVGEGG